MINSLIHVSNHEGSAPSEIYRRTRTYRVGNRPFAEIEPEFRGDPEFDYRYTSRYAELMTLTFTLGLLGYENLSIEQMERPDFEVTFSNGQQAYVEVTSIIERSSAQYGAMLDQLNVEINRLISTDPESIESLGDQFAEVILPTAPTTRSRPAIFQELRTIIRSGDLSRESPSLEVIGPDLPLLHAAQAQLFRGRRGSAGHFAVRGPARAAGPFDLINLTLQRLQRKRLQAESYSGRPLWLVLYFAEVLALYDTNLTMLSEIDLEAISPFQRVFIGDQRRMIEFSVPEVS